LVQIPKLLPEVPDVASVLEAVEMELQMLEHFEYSLEHS
jgi:hypothetical protein